MDNAKSRVALVAAINGCAANVEVAAARRLKAACVLDEEEGALLKLREEYTKLRDQLAASMSADHPAPPAHRTQLINEINACLEAVERAQKRVAKARSEDGTARTELDRLRAELVKLQQRLFRLLPDDLCVSGPGKVVPAAESGL